MSNPANSAVSEPADCVVSEPAESVVSEPANSVVSEPADCDDESHISEIVVEYVAGIRS